MMYVYNMCNIYIHIYIHIYISCISLDHETWHPRHCGSWSRLDDLFHVRMVVTVTTLSIKMAWTFPDIAGRSAVPGVPKFQVFSKLPPAPVDPPGPFYTVILIFFISAALGLQAASHGHGTPGNWSCCCCCC